jgi:hypothetical protein
LSNSSEEEMKQAPQTENLPLDKQKMVNQMTKISEVAITLLQQFDLTDNPKIKINSLEIIQI